MQGPQAECLWDEVLPAEVRELPADLSRIDELLSDPAVLEPIAEPGGAKPQRAAAMRALMGARRSRWRPTFA